MTTIPAVRRLSPRVRRLLAAHDLVARAIPGTGAGGRVTADDVEAVAGVHHGASGAGAAVLASPVARRRLRDEGVDLAAATRENDGAPIRDRDVARLLETLRSRRGGTAEGSDERSATTSDRVRTAARDVDVSRLLAHLRAAWADHVARAGRPIPVVVPVAAAVAGALATTPALRAAGGRTVTLGLVLDDAVATVADAELLTVPGLMRRALEGPVATGDPTIVVALDTAGAAALATPAAFGVLTVGSPTTRPVATTDELGLEVVTHRPHVTLRLHHDGDDERADTVLGAVAEAVAAWDREVVT